MFEEILKLLIIIKLIIFEGTDFPFGIYEHGSAYYNDTFVVVGGYASKKVSVTDIYL